MIGTMLLKKNEEGFVSQMLAKRKLGQQYWYLARSEVLDGSDYFS